MRPLFLFLLGAVSAFSQPFSAGLKAGVPLTDFFSTVNNISSSVPNRFIIGATAELHLPLGFAVEFDVLYRRLHYQTTTTLADNTTANSWEFPLLLKYRFPMPVVRPYVDAGIAWDTLSGVTNTISKNVIYDPATGPPVQQPSALAQNTTKGFVMGAGVDIHALVLHISPEIRYTRWTSQQFNLNGIIHSNQNQAEFLVGFTF